MRALPGGAWPPDAVVLLAGRARRVTSAASAGWPTRASGAVRFLGAVKDVRSLYWASDLLVMPSLYEGLANAALEGCAAGLPAVLSHAANVDGIVAPGQPGWRLPPGRQAARARAREALATPTDRLRRWGARARATWPAARSPTMWSIRWWRSTTSCWRPGRCGGGERSGRSAFERSVRRPHRRLRLSAAATAAYALSRAGLRSLLVERGGWPTATRPTGTAAPSCSARRRPARVQQNGARAPWRPSPTRWWAATRSSSAARPCGCATTDFARWPVTYADFEPHYAAAEALLEVHGRAGMTLEPPRSTRLPV